jgi:hypothetical protein
MTQLRRPTQTALQIARQLACACALWASQPAQAHHSFAMYDQTKLIQLNGKVKEFQWTNPHVILWVDTDAAGAKPSELWTIELPTSTGNLKRMGDWSKHALTPGDQVTVEINPLRDGQRGGSFKKITIASTGKVLTARPPDPDKDLDKAANAASAAQAQPVAAASNTAAAKVDSQGCACVNPGSTTREASLWLGLLWLSALGLSRARRPRPGPHSGRFLQRSTRKARS